MKWYVQCVLLERLAKERTFFVVLLNVPGERGVWSSPLEEAKLPEDDDEDDENDETEYGRYDVHPEGYSALLDSHQIWVGYRFYLQLKNYFNITHIWRYYRQTADSSVGTSPSF